jgi:hypothetical protein
MLGRLSMIATRFGLLILLAYTLSTPTAVRAADSADKVELKLNDSPGQTWKLTQRLEMEMTTTVTSRGNTHTLRDVKSLDMSVTRTTLEAKNGQPIKARLSFDKDCQSKFQSDGKDQAAAFPLAGRTVTLAITDAGKVEVEPADAFGANGGELVGYMINAQRDFLPDHPVSPGDSWTIKPEVVAKAAQVQLDRSLTGGITCTLNRIATHSGRRIAEITQKCSIAGTMVNGGLIAMNYEGPWDIDLATGETILIDTTGDIKMKTSDADLAAGQPNIQGSGTTKTRFRAQLDSPSTLPAK